MRRLASALWLCLAWLAAPSVAAQPERPAAEAPAPSAGPEAPAPLPEPPPAPEADQAPAASPPDAHQEHPASLPDPQQRTGDGSHAKTQNKGAGKGKAGQTKTAKDKTAKDKAAKAKAAKDQAARDKAAKEKAAKDKAASPKPPKRPKGCPADMAFVQNRFCIDRYEAHTVVVGQGGRERPHSPYEPVAGKKVKAKSEAGKVPQGYISRDEAEQACRAAGKRLCSDEEWVTACKGKRPTTYPYGDDWQAGRCNDRGASSFNHYYGSDGQPPPQSLYTWDNLNDPRLNQLPDTLARSGSHRRCRNGYGLYDMVGNLHEWTAAPGGTFRGGYYLDVHQNGDGCDYRTTAHFGRYHDYSTGFRCCK